MPDSRKRCATGAELIASFGYPNVLRRPTAEVLAALTRVWTAGSSISLRPQAAAARRVPRWLDVLLVVVVSAPMCAEAQSTTGAEALTATPAATQTALRVRPTVALGVGLALVGLDSYGFGLNVRGGADVLFGDLATHSLATSLGWTPYNVRGARLDLFVLDAGWRWRPSRALGFYALVSVGLAAARESFDVTLGAQRIDDTTWYFGGAAAVSIGWTLFECVDIEISYRQALLAMGTADGPGSIGASIGGRL